jgi:uncharacterized delta-60 repeat protein
MKKIYIAALITLLNYVHSSAQVPGTLDVTFGTNGIQSYTITDLKSDDGISILQLVRQTDGKFLAIIQRSDYVDSIGQYDEYHYLYRFTANGQPDPTFGTNGRVDLNFYASNLLLLTDGKILLLTSDLDELVIVRLLSNGSVDMNYGFEGKNYTGAYFYVSNALVQQSGKILICGTRQGASANLFLRLEADGNRDFSFGTDGIKLLSFIQNDRYIIVMKELPDGKLVLGCSMYSGTTYAAIVRLTADVEYDLTFSGDGEQQLKYSGFRLIDFEVTGDNRIVVGGHYYFSNFARAGLVFSRLKANGTPDSTFGVNSIRTQNFGGLFDELKSIKVQPDGRIIGVGSSDGRFGVIRLTTTGTADATFNTTGKTVTSFAGSTSAGIVHLSMEPSGKLLVVGSAFYPDSMLRFTMARYHTGFNVSVGNTPTAPVLALYPNPVTTHCTVQFTLTHTATVSLSLLDMQGKLVKFVAPVATLSAGTYLEQLNLADLPAGMYMLHLIAGTSKNYIKLMKE